MNRDALVYLEGAFYTYKIYKGGLVFPYVEYMIRLIIALFIGVDAFLPLLVLDTMFYSYIISNIDWLQDVTEKERRIYKYYLVLSLLPSMYNFFFYT